MRALALVALLSIGCAHAPQVEVARSETAFAPMSVRAALTAELLAGAPATEFNLFLLLNGEPTLIGVLTSTGTSVTELTTAVPFTVAAGQVLLFKCDAGSANVGGGSTCDATITGANHKYQLANAYDAYFTVLRSSHVCLDAPPATTINCAVFKMQ